MPDKPSEVKKPRWTTLIIVVGVVGLLAATNPSLSSYVAWFDQSVTTHSSALVSTLASIFAGPLRSLIANNTIQQNWIVLSIYHTTLMGQQVTVLGILEHFIPLAHS